MVQIKIIGDSEEYKSYDKLTSGEYYVCTNEGPYSGWILRAIKFDTIFGVWICNKSGVNQSCAVLATLTGDKHNLRFCKVDTDITFKV